MKQNYTTSLELPGLPRLFSYNNKLPALAIASFALVSLIMLYIGIYRQNEYIVLGIILGSALIYFFIKYPRFWLYTITFSLFIFFRKSEVGVSILDVIAAFLYLVTLFSWFFWQIAIKRAKLVTNLGDWFILAFFILLFSNSIIAVIHGVSFLDWIREYSIMALALFYFPYRYYFSDEKYLKRLLILLAAVCILTELQQLYDYYQIGMANVVYAYQILISARINQALFTTTTAFGILAILFEKKFLRQFIYIILTIISAFALISSFSRTFWLILLIQLVIFIIILPAKEKIKLITYSIAFSTVLILTVMIAFEGGTTVALKAYEYRLSSSTQGRKDPSVQARLAEYKVVLKRISEYPMGGNGLEKKFSFFNPIAHASAHTSITHNGFLFLFYKICIPLSLFYIFFLLYFTIKSFILFFRSKENFYKILSLGSFCGLLVMIISDFSTTLFNVRDGVFVMAFAFAFTQITEKKLLENKK